MPPRASSPLEHVLAEDLRVHQDLLYNENVRYRLLATLLLCVACTRTETVTRFVNLHQTGVVPGSARRVR